MTDIDELLLTNDILFKIIFGNKKHSRLLIHLLNAIIQPKDPIVAVDIVQTELTPELVTQKGVRLDIAATTSNGEIISIEMQKGREPHMTAGALYYWSRLFAAQLEVSDRYKNLRRTVSISILDFTLFEKDEHFWRKCFITDSMTNEKLTDLFEMHFIELGKMGQIDEKSPLTFWVEFFKNPYSEKVRSICKFVPEIKEAKEIFEKAKSDPEAQELIRLKEKATRDYVSAVADAKEEGLAEGELIGIEKGEKIGIEKGKDEKAIEVAKALLQIGDSVEKIMQVTKLTSEDIKKLKVQDEQK